MDDIYPGGRVGPGDPRYEALVRGFNLRWVGRPAEIALCGSAGQVRDVVQEAVDRNSRVTVRSGGHCYENFAVHNEGGVIVDMAPMSRVYRDEARGYCIEAGATLWNVIWTLYKEYGCALPGGSCYSVGAGGHITGGGYGLLSRKYGLVVDWLTAVEIAVVDGDGRARVVIAEKEGEGADLLWACQGGGGGNFGIVTRFWFKELPPAPAEAWLANLAWNWSDMTEVEFGRLIDRYGTFLAANSAPGSPYDGLFALLHLSHKGASQIVLTAQYVGDQPKRLSDFILHMTADGPAAVAQTHPVGQNYFPLRTAAVQRLPWLYATQTLDPSGANQRGKYKSAYMKRPFEAREMAVLWKYLTDGFMNPQALLQVDSYGCAVNAVASEATAIPQRSSIMKLQYQTYWTTEAESEANLDWIRGLYAEMYGREGPLPDDGLDGCYVNYPDCDLKDWRRLYYPGAYERLQRVKAAWDPRDIFNHAQSVRLP